LGNSIYMVRVNMEFEPEKIEIQTDKIEKKSK